jgi:hypothetical protein
MWHATCMQRSHGNSWLLMVGSQITNLTPNLTFDLSFGHNLCSIQPNGSCEPILNVYVLKDFQWYTKLHNPMGFDLVIVLWRFESPLGLQLPKWEFTWECEGSFRHTFLHSWEHEMWLLGFPLGLHPCKPLPWLRA